MNSRGGAVTEALPVIALLILFIAVILSAVYLVFARAWIDFQSEQTLYCLAENNTEWACRRRLAEKLTAGLPFGTPGELNLSNRGGLWKVKTEWRMRGYRLAITKDLDTKRILRSKALRW